MARSFLGGEFAGGESAWWRGNWIPEKYLGSHNTYHSALVQYLFIYFLIKECW